MPEPDKDKIKEILEGHSKKFSAVELIVGIAVILVIGAGVGYALFKILSPPSQPEYAHIEENIPSQVEPTYTQNQPQQEAEQQQPEAIQEPIQTESPSEKAAQTESIPQQEEGPQIINTTKTQQQTANKQSKPQTETIQKQTKQTQVSHNKPKTERSIPKKTKPHKTVIAHTKTKHTHSKKHLKKYILQVSSNSNRKLALLTVIKLRKCGYKAFTKEIEVNGKKYTRVMVGPIEGYEAAKVEAKQIKKQLHLNYTPIIKKYDKVS
ncbi:SPOR domain-containing protein [Hippea sp. KM1]|uniref:SPOR domain-containing protein n=1 Tax=Hippea sp. KM1 TaxID=944481 RepID=UPI00046D763A|nr:SPOR domain-containing protein [Hippea sp. KM1]